MGKKFTYTIEIEFPDKVDPDWFDEYALSAINLVPEVCSTSFEGIKLSVLDIKKIDGTSVGGYPRNDDVKEFVFLSDGYNFSMVDKERKSRLEKRLGETKQNL